LTNAPKWSMIIYSDNGYCAKLVRTGGTVYLVTMKYSDDPERKRIEYILEKWKKRLNITKPQGIVVILEGGEIEGFIEELYSRTSSSNVGVYRLEKTVVDVEKSGGEIRLKLGEKKETVEKLIGFVMAKQKAILKREMKEPFERIYELSTKKGKAEISVALRNEGQGTALRMRITGYGEVVEFLYDKFSSELNYFEGR